ncbi:SapC family protein [Breoghania sp. L-A4]|uniref:SapC family protein n=1 Tax=Breoghania sp. L-A4 TaxID=2304600 RepID=UPI000E35F0BC|nr:SapC family protein [Breoghania sp. L-A4]AXS40549.1 SapC family protein [Breoghania sp. L-A4]
MTDDPVETPAEGNGAGSAAAAAQGGAMMPLFYSAPEALNPDRHGALGLDSSDDMSFAAATQAIPITLAEFPAACRTYPIVFVGRDVPQPVAMVGLRQQQNLFVGADGRWKPSTYVPGYVRRYPYILVRENSGDNFALCIDSACPRLRDGGEVPLFVDGKPSEQTEKALEFCATFQRQAGATDTFVARLKELDLLVSNQAQFTLKDGETVRIADYFVIDERRLQELPDEAYLGLRNDGLMAGIYCQLLSTQVWPDLVAMAE